MPKLSFKAFLSHAYDAEKLNIGFFKIFDSVADVRFEVDKGSKSLNVTRLERRIRDCDAFVGLYPLPGEPNADPTPAQALQATRYFRLEMELAARARRPGIIFYDKRLQPAIQRLEGFSEHDFAAHDVDGHMTTRFLAEMETVFGDFCRRLEAEIRGRASGFEAKRHRHEVGLLVPRGKDGYPEEAIRTIKEVATEYGHPELVDLGWPPVADARFFDRLDSLDWAFVDVSPGTAATGMLGLLHSRFVPAVRMHSGSGPPEPEEWVQMAGIGGLFGGLDVGYRKDIVYWRGDVTSLGTQLRSRVRVALKPPGDDEVIKSAREAMVYFQGATEKLKVFLSYAGADLEIAERVLGVLREHSTTVFDYKDRGESLPPGSRWREKIKQDIQESQAGIILVSDAYKDSGYCQWEKDLLVDQHQDRKMPLFPILLEGQAREAPTGLESLQVLRLEPGEEFEDAALRLARQLKSPSTG